MLQRDTCTVFSHRDFISIERPNKQGGTRVRCILAESVWLVLVYGEAVQTLHASFTVSVLVNVQNIPCKQVAPTGLSTTVNATEHPGNMAAAGTDTG